MNLKEIRKRMTAGKRYRWAESPLGMWHLFGETGRTICIVPQRYEAERISRQLIGMGFRVEGPVKERQLL